MWARAALGQGEEESRKTVTTVKEKSDSQRYDKLLLPVGGPRILLSRALTGSR